MELIFNSDAHKDDSDVTVRIICQTLSQPYLMLRNMRTFL